MGTIITEHRNWTRRDVAELLISKTALTELDLEDALKIVAVMVPKRFKAGTKLTQEGFTNTDYMVLLLQGEVVVENEFVNSEESMVLSVLGTGSIVGELGILDGHPRSATCTAVSDLDAAVLNREHFTGLMREEPRAACNLMGAILKRVSERLRATNKKLRTLTVINRSLLDELGSLKQADAALVPPVAAAAQAHPTPVAPRVPAKPVAKPAMPATPAAHSAEPLPPLPSVSTFGPLADAQTAAAKKAEQQDDKKRRGPEDFRPTYPGSR